MSERLTFFVKVVLPIPLPKLYTYRVPQEFNEFIQVGQRVAVPFGSKKVYSGIIWEITEEPPQGYQATYVLDILDNHALVSPLQIEFWTWISTYYMSYLGDVLSIALPAGFRVESLTKISLHPDFDPEEIVPLDSKENDILAMLLTQKFITVEQIQSSLKAKSVLKYVKSMYQKGLISMEEELKENYKPKFAEWAEATSVWDDMDEANRIITQLEKKSEKQYQAILLILGSSQRKTLASTLTANRNIDRSVLKALEKKGLLKLSKVQEDRYQALQGEGESIEFTPAQQAAIAQIQHSVDQLQPALLHGATGSGKTLIYLHFAKQALEQGKQVLFLVPEVALTEHLVHRIAQNIPEEIGVWHHYYSINERTELYEKVRLQQLNFVIGTRNALFAPFSNLGLIIVDEEHESSYKQFEKRPMFHARDAAFQLAKLTNSPLIMGSATPSYELWQLAKDKVVNKVVLSERYEQQAFAAIDILNVTELKQQNRMNGFFSDRVIEEIKEKMSLKQKVIVYHNRKGYAPFIQCSLCGHSTQCSQCDIHLTYYKSSNQQRCNYCGLQQEVPRVCVACGGNDLIMKGVGTEKIVEELNLIFPEARIARFDQQSIKKRSDFQKILHSFDSGEIEILVGTQLLAKGIDFNDVALIVVPDADVMLNVPDFRSHERGFQQLYQLAGRAGRRKQQGLVLVQTYQPQHTVIQAVLDQAYESLAENEIVERDTFNYPPFSRIIEITVKHKDQQVAYTAANYFHRIIHERMGQRLLGPLTPNVARVKNYHLQQFMVKMHRQKDNIPRIKEYLLWAQEQLIKGEGFSGVRVDFDVDPN